ncbi:MULTISPECIES: ExbD/TolR family protein [Rhodobacterales]|jgi:biopolymer transport protein ExbD|uniref:ExbD/TolR family protein n=1 Tax=Rhodobacterales TaxID=204455 RepID=UPI00237F17D2|nr:biopolymer transporter ExbD [Phaeobacter gallaeciensis]MDE4139821.1 biopolymer transporter ExbD [Phaeobacter gallaeciensis]MDE4148569.1 biopolymer transporter ExbD [Phaeobacter gallaeciensis]MDE4152484.1 biopolymer transporter ExbD [Phaeobacter gallaeciensis]MDE4228180.1 biopolymer transporter ExbD [Phaeobacter gallaeciensis]MDE4256948.1 biopolymer transporter ExbD [Phaeobacter gallaeciensis]
MILKRASRPRALISLVPMIDVMLILLVFFMVTSTYLNLDMIPALRASDGATGLAAARTDTVMIRLGADGVPVIRGQPLSGVELDNLLHSTIAADSLTQVLILPSGAASTQALISVMDKAAQADVQQLRVLRLEVQP